MNVSKRFYYAVRATLLEVNIGQAYYYDSVEAPYFKHLLRPMLPANHASRPVQVRHLAQRCGLRLWTLSSSQRELLSLRVGDL